MNKHFIELNGKRYDAITGALITNAPAVASRPTQPAAAKAATPPKPRRDHHLAQPTPSHGHKPQTPKTLMRRVVTKPTLTPKPAVRKQYPIATTDVHSRIAIKKSATAVDITRLKRAQAAPKSTAVQKFPNPQPVSVHKAIPAKPAATTSHIPVRIAPVQVTPAPIAQSKQTVSKPIAPKPNIFEQALADAKSHEEPAHKPLKVRKSKKSFHRKLAVISAGVMAIVVVGGFAAYVNRDAIQFEVASVRAGFPANKPSYTPTGYVAGAATGEQGKVTIDFASTEVNESFTLTQASSNWDSQDLFDDIVARYDTTYQTIQSGGRTIYLYGNNEAAWVNGGILYTVKGNAALETEQLISLATSL